MTCAFPWLCRLWKHSVRKQIYEKFVSTFCALLRSTIVEFEITKPCVPRRHWLKAKLSFFLLNLIACYLPSALFFCRTNRAHWRSVIDSQLLTIKNKPSNSQGSKMTYKEHNFAISPDFLHFPRLHWNCSFHRRQLSLWFVTLFVRPLG